MTDADISNAVLKTIRQIIRAIDLQSKQLVKKYGLTGPQLVVLKEIAEVKEISIGQLSRDICLSQATVTNIVDRLETKGALRRIRSPEDRRKVMVQATEKTFTLLAGKPSLFQENFIHEFQKLPLWEKTQLLSSLQRLAEMMNADKLKAEPVLVSGPLDETEPEL